MIEVPVGEIPPLRRTGERTGYTAAREHVIRSLDGMGDLTADAYEINAIPEGVEAIAVRNALESELFKRSLHRRYRPVMRGKRVFVVRKGVEL